MGCSLTSDNSGEPGEVGDPCVLEHSGTTLGSGVNALVVGLKSSLVRSSQPISSSGRGQGGQVGDAMLLPGVTPLVEFKSDVGLVGNSVDEAFRCSSGEVSPGSVDDGS